MKTQKKTTKKVKTPKKLSDIEVEHKKWVHKEKELPFDSTLYVSWKLESGVGVCYAGIGCRSFARILKSAPLDERLAVTKIIFELPDIRGCDVPKVDVNHFFKNLAWNLVS